MRSVADILRFRTDISPFLVHLTRSNDETSAEENLSQIIKSKELIAKFPVSDARFCIHTSNLTSAQKLEFFGAVCLTETPINEIHCLLEIEYRKINLAPFGLVFIKERLRDKGVSPVMYLNNYLGDTELAMKELVDKIISDNLLEAQKLLPLFSVFGKKYTAPNAKNKQEGNVDFIWEREWRYPHLKGSFKIEVSDVFIGLCLHDKISEFEQKFHESFGEQILFVDPTRNLKWYANKLIEARQRLDLKYSVI